MKKKSELWWGEYAVGKKQAERDRQDEISDLYRWDLYWV